MDVYKVSPASYAAPEARNQEEFVRSVGLAAFTGRPMRAQWPEPALELTDPTMLASDFFYFGLGGLAFPPRTHEVFKDLFEKVGEVLPFTLSGAPFFALNVLRCVSGLDAARSEVRRLPNGNIIKVTRYAFHASVVKQEALFQIPEEVSAVFTVSSAPESFQDFYQTYSQRRMTGLKFDRVWTHQGSA
jgi:hypothetical protein